MKIILDERSVYEQKHIFTITWLITPQTYLDNYSPLEAVYNPKLKEKLARILQKPDIIEDDEKELLVICQNMIYEQLGWPPYNLKTIDKYEWVAVAYRDVGEWR